MPKLKWKKITQTRVMESGVRFHEFVARDTRFTYRLVHETATFSFIGRGYNHIHFYKLVVGCPEQMDFNGGYHFFPQFVTDITKEGRAALESDKIREYSRARHVLDCTEMKVSDMLDKAEEYLEDYGFMHTLLKYNMEG